MEIERKLFDRYRSPDKGEKKKGKKKRRNVMTGMHECKYKYYT